MKNCFEGRRVSLKWLLLLSICTYSITTLDDDFDHLFEEYNNFREKQNEQNGQYDDGKGLTLTKSTGNSQTRQLTGTEIIQ